MQALNNRMSTREFTTQTLPREQVSNLLWAAFGINRPESGKRKVATAANCQDIDVFGTLMVKTRAYEATRVDVTGAGGQVSPLANYISYTPKMDGILKQLADLKPKTLAIMHGSSFAGDGKHALGKISAAMRDVFGGWLEWSLTVF